MNNLDLENVKIKKILKAADILEERGLARGTFQDTDGTVCAVGALRIAFGSEDGWHVPLNKEGSDVDQKFNATRVALDLVGSNGNIIPFSDRHDDAHVVAEELRLRAAELKKRKETANP